MLICTMKDGAIRYDSSVIIEESFSTVQPEGYPFMTWGVDRGTYTSAQTLLLGGTAVMSIVEGKLTYISSDVSGRHDVFFSKHDGGYLVSDEFLSLASRLGCLTVDQEALQFFLYAGNMPCGRTYFCEIQRLRPGRALVLERGEFTEVLLFSAMRSSAETSRDYTCFKDVLRGALKSADISNHDAILLSGGVDSGLITALSFLELGTKPKLATIAMKPSLQSNEEDVIASAAIADFYGAEHIIAEVDFDVQEPSLLNDFVEKMPLSAHLSLGFHNVLKIARDSECRRVLSGQNADALYNLGPTTSIRGIGGIGLGSMVKRFYLSRNYIRTLPDVSKTSPLTSWPLRCLGAAGALAISKRTSGGFTLPRNLNQLNQVLESDFRIPSNVERFSLSVSPLEARRLLFDTKLASYVVGRDSRVIFAAGEMLGVNVLLPYSMPDVVAFFRDLEIEWQDVLIPKRYIRRYLREIVGPKYFRLLYCREVTGTTGLSGKQWERRVLLGTPFGTHLCKVLNLGCEATLQTALSQYWYHRVTQTLHNRGVLIKREQ